MPTDGGTTAEALPCEDSGEVTREDRLALFRLVLLHRLIEERVGLLYRQGRISGSVYTGRGQEAVGRRSGLRARPGRRRARRSIASSPATSRAASPPAEAFRNFLGKGDSPTRGRDGNMHFGARERGVFPLVSMLGDLCPVVVGAALAFKRRRRAARRADVLGRRRDEHRRRPRGPQPRRRAEGAGRVRAAVQRLRVLHARPAGR